MDKDIIITMVCAVLASPVVVKIIDKFIEKFNKKETQLDRIEKTVTSTQKELDVVKVEECRTNLMLLLHAFRDSGDIARLAKQYVVDYNGDSYLIPLIVAWYKEKEIAYPEWLKQAYEEHGGYALDEHDAMMSKEDN